jgi:hypothetical protein
MSGSGPSWFVKADKLKRHLRPDRWAELAEEMNIGERDKSFMAMRQGKSSLRELLGNLEVARIPKIVEESFRSVGAKLLKGIYCKGTGLIFPSVGRVAVEIIPNYSLLFGSGNMLEEIAKRIPGIAIPIEAQSADLSDQFKLRISIASDNAVAIAIAMFSESVVLCMIGFADPGLLQRDLPEWIKECFVE